MTKLVRGITSRLTPDLGRVFYSFDKCFETGADPRNSYEKQIWKFGCHVCRHFNTWSRARLLRRVWKLASSRDFRNQLAHGRKTIGSHLNSLLFRKSRHKPNLEGTSKYGFFPRFGGKKWRRSEHAHASYPGLSFRPPGFSPYRGREQRRVQGLDYGDSFSGCQRPVSSRGPARYAPESAAPAALVNTCRSDRLDQRGEIKRLRMIQSRRMT